MVWVSLTRPSGEEPTENVCEGQRLATELQQFLTKFLPKKEQSEKHVHQEEPSVPFFF